MLGLIKKFDFFEKFLSLYGQALSATIVAALPKGGGLARCVRADMRYFIPGMAMPLRTAFTASSVREEEAVLAMRLFT